MKKITLSVAALGLAFAPLLFAAPAHAQATRTWVSGVGDDVNPCSRTAPCKTYAGAISKTATNGEINCLDPGGFGSLTITKSISVVCDYTEGGVLANGVFGFNINAPAGSIITLKGQDVECVGTGTNGIQILGVGVAVHVHKTQIRNCRNSGGSNGNGISITPSSGTAEVFVADSYLTDNGGLATNAGILAQPTGAASVVLTVNRTQLENNTSGIIANVAAGNTGTIKGTIRDSLVAGHTNNGITATGNGTVVTLIVDNVSVVGNNFGFVAGGSSGGLLVGRSTATGNTTAVSAVAPAAVLSYGDNLVNNNTGGETFSPGSPVAKK
jgi:hypothetical protein